MDVVGMRGEDFTTALQTLGLDTQDAAKWLGVSVRAVQRYRVSGAPGPVAGMVRLAVRIDEFKNATPIRFVQNPDKTIGLALDWRE